MIRDNWQGKVIAFCFAVVLWSYVHISKYDTVILNVPVSYVNIPNELAYVIRPSVFTKVTIRGRKQDLTFSTSSLQGKVDLSSGSIGVHDYPLTLSTSLFPDSITISYKDKISVHLDKIFQTYLWVKVPFKGNIAEGYRQGRLEVKPHKILCFGTKNHFSKQIKILSKPLNITKVTKKITTQLALLSPHPMIRLATQSVEVEMDILKKDITNERKFNDISIQVTNLHPKIYTKLGNTKVDFIVRGDPKILEQLNSNLFKAVVNLDWFDYNEKTPENYIGQLNSPMSVPISPLITAFKEQVMIVEVLPSDVAISLHLIKETVTPSGIATKDIPEVYKTRTAEPSGSEVFSVDTASEENIQNTKDDFELITSPQKKDRLPNSIERQSSSVEKTLQIQ